MKQYDLKTGLFSKPRKLILTEHYVEFENIGLKEDTFKRLNKEDIKDFKHGMDWIVWYRVVVGQHFSITFKDKRNNELKIFFKNYFGLNKHYFNLYAAIVDDIWRYYHQGIVNAHLEKLHHDEALSLKGLKLNKRGVEMGKDKPFLPWSNIMIKEYDSYFAVYDKDKPALHTRISYNEYETETLWGAMMAILQQSAGKE